MKTMAYNRNRLIVVAAGAIASLLIGFTLTPTFAALVASIQNSTNTANTGTLTMKETSGSATDLCDKIKVKITSGASVIFDGSAKAFQTGGAINLLAKLSKTGVNPSESIPIKVAVSLDSSAGPTYQGLQISQPMTWTFSA